MVYKSEAVLSSWHLVSKNSPNSCPQRCKVAKNTQTPTSAGSVFSVLFVFGFERTIWTFYGIERGILLALVLRQDVSNVLLVFQPVASASSASSAFSASSASVSSASASSASSVSASSASASSASTSLCGERLVSL